MTTERVEWMWAHMPHFAHGGDYNPEQWTPAFGYEDEAIWREDMRLMRLAHVNVATVGVFSWVSLQPDEDSFTFEWLDTVLEKLHAAGRYVCLATPSAAQPAWMSQKYPDVLRADDRGRRVHHGGRASEATIPTSLNATVTRRRRRCHHQSGRRSSSRSSRGRAKFTLPPW